MASDENFRNSFMTEPCIFAPYNNTQQFHTPLGTLQSTLQAPELPPRLFSQQNISYGTSPAFGSTPFGSGLYGFGHGGHGNNVYSGYGNNSYNNYGNQMGAYGTYGFGCNNYGAYNRFGHNPINHPETRFIQIAEESSRPAFQSIESLVSAIGNIAAMLESTMFAITSSFRAILGVAANFGRLRGVFAQLWSTFAIFRGISWIYKKALYKLKLSKDGPELRNFQKVFNTAQKNGISGMSVHKEQSTWPILAFLGFIFCAPYLIMKLIGNVSTSAIEQSKNPQTWMNPIKTTVLYDFNAVNSHELTIRTGQLIVIAPKEIQNTNRLINTGWVLATLDNQTSGLIPINYVGNPHYTDEQKHKQVSDSDESNTTSGNLGKNK